MDARRKRLLWIALAIFAALAVGLSLAWKFTALREVVTVENATAAIEAIDSRWWAPILVAALYTPAAVVLFPRPLLTIAVAAVFGPWKGFAIAMAGVLVSALVLYGVGTRVKEATLRRLAGPGIDRLKRMLKKEGLWAVTLVGLVPVAPFAVEMIAAGALRVRLRHLLPGVALAHLPGTIGTTLIGDQVTAAMSSGREVNRMVIVAVVALVAAVGFATRRAWRRLEAAP